LPIAYLRKSFQESNCIPISCGTGVPTRPIQLVDHSFIKAIATRYERSKHLYTYKCCKSLAIQNPDWVLDSYTVLIRQAIKTT
ncbi:MAG: hypothetical protein SAK29_33385, partial [Scytonema sp. PMC 1069.18]|nr:hypothetical protein [Scytonema sp. PMC 1069.18]